MDAPIRRRVGFLCVLVSVNIIIAEEPQSAPIDPKLNVLGRKKSVDNMMRVRLCRFWDLVERNCFHRYDRVVGLF